MRSSDEMGGKTMSNAYDPILYAYMRACGAPSTYYRNYLTELTPANRRKYRKPPKPLPNLHHPTQLDWVTPDITTIAATYLRADMTVPTCQRNVETAKTALLDAHTPLKQAGARRTLVHAQAKLLAALMRAWQDTEDGLLYADNYRNLLARAIPSELSAAQDDKIRTQQEIYVRRQRRKYAQRKLALLTVEWEDLKERYRAVRQAYLVARAKWRYMQVKLVKARAAQRARADDYAACAPADVIYEWKHARGVFRDALKDRDTVRREWKACKVKLYRLNKVGSS
jgi:hypothetical protein